MHSLGKIEFQLNEQSAADRDIVYDVFLAVLRKINDSNLSKFDVINVIL
jgi:hypothetical protein